VPLQGYNLCYSTLVNANDVARLPADTYEKSPSGHVFVRSSHKKGLLPQILDELLAARKRGMYAYSTCYVVCVLCVSCACVHARPDVVQRAMERVHSGSYLHSSPPSFTSKALLHGFYVSMIRCTIHVVARTVL
jgi:hypothetical protein